MKRLCNPITYGIFAKEIMNSSNFVFLRNSPLQEECSKFKESNEQLMIFAFSKDALLLVIFLNITLLKTLSLNATDLKIVFAIIVEFSL